MGWNRNYVGLELELVGMELELVGPKLEICLKLELVELELCCARFGASRVRATLS